MAMLGFRIFSTLKNKVLKSLDFTVLVRVLLIELPVYYCKRLSSAAKSKRV